MKLPLLTKLLLVLAAVLPIASPAFALDGQIQIHDPSTILQCDGKHYTYRTGRALTATEEGELIAPAVFTGGPEQLWRIDQLTDGTWRLMPKSAPNSKELLALSAIGSSFATFSKFNPNGDQQRWFFKAP